MRGKIAVAVLVCVLAQMAAAEVADSAAHGFTVKIATSAV